MLINPLAITTSFINSLSDSLKTIKSSAALTMKQKMTLAVIIMGIIVTQTLNFAAFERRSIGKEKAGKLRWLLRSAKIAWHHMLEASVRNILAQYGITSGVLVVDDTDKKRAKKTSKIAATQKIKDKATGGYINGQRLVFLVLVTNTATFPVDFRFYQPDPTLSAWSKKNKSLKKQGVSKKDRPTRPKADRYYYPTIQQLVLDMLGDFVANFPNLKIKGVLADALYGTGKFMDQACEITGGAQVVSQLRVNQIASNKNSKTSLKNYFSRQLGVQTSLTIRGDQKKNVTMLAARLHVKAHGKRRFVVALKYEGEDNYRYLVASDLSWRYGDIARLYTLRWLVEVFIQDWKTYGGWNRLTKQQGVTGSTHGVILSLLVDHLLLLHPEQKVRLKNKQPGLPVGCLIEQLNNETLVETIRNVVQTENPNEALKQLAQALKANSPVRDSRKHMSGRDLGRQEPTPSLVYHAMAA